MPTDGISMRREAFLNWKLACSWATGEQWAALDYSGLEPKPDAAATLQAKYFKARA